jgi:hypothetical protein
MKPQTTAILELLTAAGPDGATPIDALRECSCFRMAARVAELRGAGHNVVTTWETDTDGTRWARYVLLPPRPIPDTGIQEAMTW